MSADTRERGAVRRLVDAKLVKFAVVGAANTLLSAAIMFGLYRWFGLGYWCSSAISYVAGALFGFAANRAFTFKDKGGVASSALRFALTVAVCYLVAFSIAKPAMRWALSGMTLSGATVEQVAMVVAMFLYTGMNYLAQRLFVFQRQGDADVKA